MSRVLSFALHLCATLSCCQAFLHTKLGFLPQKATFKRQFASPPSATPLPTRTENSVFERHFEKKDSTKNPVLTYLEINGWIMTINGMTLLVDPILEGPLDFGIPAVYKATKRVLPTTGLIQPNNCDWLDKIDALVLTQGLDDHSHVKTLNKLGSISKFANRIPVVAPPSAKPALEGAGFPTSNLRFLNHGQSLKLRNQEEPSLDLLATKGALVGPPWQARENGYIIKGGDFSLYIEPHAEFDANELQQNSPVDLVISPIVGQQINTPLVPFELVHGPRDTERIVEILKPKYLVPMMNGNVDTEGPLSKVVSEIGSAEEFRRNNNRLQTVQIIDAQPGEPLEIKR